MAAHGPFSPLRTQQGGKATAKRCALSSLHVSRLRPGGTCLGEGQPHHIRPAAGPRALPGLSVLPSQPLRVISCFSSRGLAPGKAGVVPTASHWFPSVQRQALWLSPSVREHVSHSPLKLFPPLIPSLEARCCPGRDMV